MRRSRPSRRSRRFWPSLRPSWTNSRSSGLLFPKSLLPKENENRALIRWVAIRANVRFGSEADIREQIRGVRFTPRSRHAQQRDRPPLHADSVDRRENHIEQNVLLSWGNGESPSPSTIRIVASATV